MCESQNRHEMLETEPLHRLLEEKWDMFASKMFFVNFIVYMVYLGIFTAVAFYRKEGQVTQNTLSHINGTSSRNIHFI